MCSQSDHPPYDDPSSDYGPPRECRHMIWTRGTERACGSVSGLRTWRDASGHPHAACRFHLRSMRYRYPESIDPDGIHETHSQDPSEGPSAADCPVCTRALMSV